MLVNQNPPKFDFLKTPINLKIEHFQKNSNSEFPTVSYQIENHDRNEGWYSMRSIDANTCHVQLSTHSLSHIPPRERHSPQTSTSMLNQEVNIHENLPFSDICVNVI